MFPICFSHFSSFSFFRQMFSGCRRPFQSLSMTPLFLSISLLLICSHFVSPSKAFILQELPLYRNVRNQRNAVSPSANAPLNVPSSGNSAHRGHSIALPLLLKIEDGIPFFMRPSRAFNFHRMNRLQNFWHRNEALKRLTQIGNTL